MVIGRVSFSSPPRLLDPPLADSPSGRLAVSRPRHDSGVAAGCPAGGRREWPSDEEGDPVVELGYALSCEEHAPNDLVRYAKRAEDVGFTFALISDHYHPWIDRTGHSPFAWAVIGGIA